MSVVTVLVVEDDDVTRELIASRLELAGHDVVAVASAPDAREQLGEDLPDVMVSDMFMPGGSALALVAELRGNPETTQVPVVLLSGRALPADAEAGRALGCSYLSKPFAPKALLRAVGEAAEAPTRMVASSVRDRLAELGDVGDPAERALFSRLLLSFAAQAPVSLVELTSAAACGDDRATRAVAHKLAGSAANLGVLQLADGLREVEQVAEHGDVQALDLRKLRHEGAIARRAVTTVAHELHEAASDEADGA
ncbi:Hpt domain-containing protein [Quadrisphaera granulorum]|uniref:Hpt domain-containing protein n=1 Tax=Quadrisphaera granulorum TaxID=317664 RepID=A0A315ZVT8_9ACTN|nr:response regulator [Quadrisphaera granulorum]PWJ49060.1 Hpt domain-containing protein [Quadrisphaera granulorum]SZE98270.1 Hpt domain-containing protein [Quadrisphaera granulorum]